MFDINQLIRENIRDLQPYTSAKDDFKGVADILLDANENSLGSLPRDMYNRYPDPYQKDLKQAIAGLKNIAIGHIFLGNGSDECIDLLYRCFCDPGKDNTIVCPPTYGMYEVSGRINDVEIRKAVLKNNFQLDLNAIEDLSDDNTKIIWICSPNNPTGNTISENDIYFLLEKFNGLVVIDEAYIDFSASASFLNSLKHYPNLVVLQTLSKAWGLASLRVGIAYASAAIIAVLNKVKPPYNISGASQNIVLSTLQQTDNLKARVQEILTLRSLLKEQLEQIQFIETVYRSEANFLLVKMKDPEAVYHYLLANGIVVRNRSGFVLCGGCLRITVGTKLENEQLIKILKNYSKKI